MASEVGIANRALQRLGANRITSLTESSRNARSVNAAYTELRDAELRRHTWHFSIKRAQLAASSTDPAFGPAKAYPLPSDFLRLLPPDAQYHSNDLDWKIEGDAIVTGESAPLNIRYVARIEDPNLMDALFREALALRIAKELCEELTQSNTKYQLVEQDYRAALREAMNTNAIEQPVQDPPEDTWITVRL